MEASSSLAASSEAERANTPQVRASFSIWAFSAGSVVVSKASMSLSIFALRRVCSVSLQTGASSLLPAMTQRYGASGLR